MKFIKTGYMRVTDLTHWDKNPRAFSEEGIERIKDELLRLKPYKPLICTPDGIVIGGNVRLEAMKLLQTKKAWVSVVECKNDQEKLAISIADNDMIGETDQDKLLALMKDQDRELFKNYVVDVGMAKNLNELMEMAQMGTLGGGDEGAPLMEGIAKLILPFKVKEYDQAILKLDRIMVETDKQSYTEAVMYLLETYAN